MISNNLPHRLVGGGKSFLRMVATLIVVLAIIGVGELLPPMRALDAYLKEHPGTEQFFLWLTIIMSIVGILTLALAQFLPHPRLPANMRREEVEAQSPPIKFREDNTRTGGRFSRTIGGEFSGEASFANTKEAWRRSSWRYDRRWRLLFVMMLGAICLFFGMFGLFIVVGSPGVKFLMISIILYAVVRTIWSFSRA